MLFVVFILATKKKSKFQITDGSFGNTILLFKYWPQVSFRSDSHLYNSNIPVYKKRFKLKKKLNKVKIVR